IQLPGPAPLLFQRRLSGPRLCSPRLLPSRLRDLLLRSSQAHRGRSPEDLRGERMRAAALQEKPSYEPDLGELPHLLSVGDLDAAGACFARDACLVTPGATAVHG